MGPLQRQIMLAPRKSQLLLPVLQTVLPQDVDNVAPEPRHALAQPEPEDILHLLQHRRIVVVEVRLTFRKQMQIILTPLRVKFPAVLPKEPCPVVRQTSVRHTVLPVVVIRIFTGPVPALPEPVVLRRGVVDDQIHNDPDAPLLRLADEPFHVLHGAVLRIDLPVIADIVPVVRVWGLINRTEPDSPHPQLLQVVQPADDARDIPDPVPVGVLKASGIDLVDDRVLPPFHQP